MSTKEALQEYDTCASQIFSDDNKKSWSYSERYRATRLQEIIERLVKERGLGESMRDPSHPAKGKVCVSVMPSGSIGKPRFVRSFTVGDQEGASWDKDVSIWQAARATTAASSYFKPQLLGSGKSAQEYIDAAIGANNPVEYLLREAVDEFGAARPLGCVVSIGTGTRGNQLGRASTGWRNFVQAPVYYWRLLHTLKTTATDCEETHRHLASRTHPFPGSYFRFNVPEAANINLHDYKQMPFLKSSTAAYLAGPEASKQVEEVAAGLGADLFDHSLTLGHIGKNPRPLFTPRAQKQFLTPLANSWHRQGSSRLGQGQSSTHGNPQLPFHRKGRNSGQAGLVLFAA